MLRTILRQTSSITAVTLLFSPAPGGAPVSSTQPSTLAKLQRRQREDEKKHFSVNEAIGSEVKHFTDSKQHISHEAGLRNNPPVHQMLPSLCCSGLESLPG